MPVRLDVVRFLGLPNFKYSSFYLDLTCSLVNILTRNTLNYKADQPAGNIDFFFDFFTGYVRRDFFIGFGGGNRFFFGNFSRNHDFRADLAVDLHRQANDIFGDQFLVPLRPITDVD